MMRLKLGLSQEISERGRVHRAIVVVSNCVLISLMGCTAADRPQTVPIQGRVTLEKGNWPTEGVLHFLPLQPAPNFPRRAARATFNTSGEFSSPTSWAEGDGIVPGRYRVYVECWKVRPTLRGAATGRLHNYRVPVWATSDIEVEITPKSEDDTFEWDFPANEQ